MKRIASLIMLGLITYLGSDFTSKYEFEENEKLEAIENTLDDLLKETLVKAEGQLSTFLTFQKGDAEEAMNFYIELFNNSKVIDVTRWGKEGPGKEGTIMHATFLLNGNQFMCSDSPPVHDWDFTPAVSNYVECKNENEIDQLFAALSKNGQVMMPLNNYGFSQKFGFVVDRFGVSWQLNLK